MSTFIANLSLLISFIISLISIQFANYSNSHSHSLHYKALFMQLFCAALPFLILVYSSIVSDFNIKNVFFSTSSILPIGYKIASTWSTHEGSMLFWLFLISSIFLFNIRFIDNNLLYAGLPIISLMLSFFSGFIYFFANPFTKIGNNIMEGAGLNPILQDIGLMIHPVILYFGYAISAIIFFYGCMALLTPQNINLFLNQITKYSKILLLTLITGVSLGSWWAYRELGWGGYWFFDPVENISLMPLVLSIALYHSATYCKHYRTLVKYTILFSLSIFLLSIVGTFFVRSGLLISVHTFSVSKENTIVLSYIIILITVITYGFYFSRIPYITIEKIDTHRNFLLILFGNFIWIIFTAIILYSLLYPIYLEYTNIKISIEPHFFCYTIIPLGLIASITISFAHKDYFKYKILISLILGILSTYALTKQMNCFYLNIKTLSIFCGFLLLSSQIIKLLTERNNSIASILSHIGYATLILSISINTILSREYDFIGTVGDIRHFDEYELRISNILYNEEKNYYSQTVEFICIDHKNDNNTVLKPENRLYKIEKSIASDSYIHDSYTKDLYIVLSMIKEEVVHAKFYVKPFIKMIWMSCILMLTGIVISMFNRNQHYQNSNMRNYKNNQE